MLKTFDISTAQKVLDMMSADAGIVCGFSIFVPFQDGEIEQFFAIEQRFHDAVQRYYRRLGLPLGKTEESDRALYNMREEAMAGVDAAIRELHEFRLQVIKRFKASKKSMIREEV